MKKPMVYADLSRDLVTILQTTSGQGITVPRKAVNLPSQTQAITAQPDFVQPTTSRSHLAPITAQIINLSNHVQKTTQGTCRYQKLLPKLLQTMTE